MSLFELSPREAAKPRHLRKRGIIPVGLVEKSHTTLPLQITQQNFKTATQKGVHAQMDLQIEGEKKQRKAILKKIDLDALGREIVSITLQEVSMDDMVKMDVAIVAVGENEDAKAGGVTLTLVTTHLKLKGKVSDIPDSLSVDISNLPAGGTITAGEVELPSGLELQNTPDTIVFSNTINRAPELPEDVVEPEEGEAAEGSADEEAPAEQE